MGYVWSGYGVAFVGLIVYTASIVWRRRRG